MKIIAKTKEIIEQYVIQDGKEFLIKLQYNQREYAEFNASDNKQERQALKDTFTYDKLNQENQKAKQEIINKLVAELKPQTAENKETK